MSFFWTDTVNGWRPIFRENRHIVISSLRNLVVRNKIAVYGLVIMPNHLHLIGEMKELNGKEMPQASFNKFTNHSFFKDMAIRYPKTLSSFGVEDGDWKYRLWQRDPLAVLMDSRQKVEQKLTYIHLNRLQSHWDLAQNPTDYFWSSARFYESGKDDFGFFH